MAINQLRLRRLHSTLAPIMVFPLLLTLLTGMAFQIASLGGQAGDWIWLLELHQGKFGRIDLSMVYPFLNALGLLTMLTTGIVMWWQRPQRRKKAKA